MKLVESILPAPLHFDKLNVNTGEDERTSIKFIQKLIFVSGFKTSPSRGGRGEDQFQLINSNLNRQFTI
jgi:hypothetical protein